MKKSLLALLAVLCLCVGSAKAMYLIGEPAGGWDPSKGLEMTEISAGVWSLKLNASGGDYFGFANNLGGGWDQFNAQRYGSTSNGLSVEDNTYDVKYPGTDTWTFSKSGNVTLTLNTNTKKLTVLYDGQGGDDDDEIVVYFQNTAGWEKVFAYNWDNGSTSVTVELTATTIPDGSGKLHEVYAYTLKYPNLLFKSSGENDWSGFQTGDFKNLNASNEGWVYAATSNQIAKIVNGVYCQPNGDPWEVASGSGPDFGTKVYFDNTSHWPVVGAYIWNSGGPEAVWPGYLLGEGNQELVTTEDGSTKTLYFVYLGDNTSVIFNDGKEKNGSQTSDINDPTDGAVFDAGSWVVGTIEGTELKPYEKVDMWYISYKRGADWEYNQVMRQKEETTNQWQAVVNFAAGAETKNLFFFSTGLVSSGKPDWYNIANGYRFGSQNNEQSLSAPVTSALPMVKDTNNCWYLPNGTYTFTVDASDPDNPKLTIAVGDVADGDSYPSRAYVVGSFNDWSHTEGEVDLIRDMVNPHVWVGSYIPSDNTVDLKLGIVGYFMGTQKYEWYGATSNETETVAWTVDGLNLSYTGSIEADNYNVETDPLPTDYWVIPAGEYEAGTPIKFAIDLREGTFGLSTTKSYDLPVKYEVVYTLNGWADESTAEMTVDPNYDNIYLYEIPGVPVGSTLNMVFKTTYADGKSYYVGPKDATGSVTMEMPAEGSTGVIDTTMPIGFVTDGDYKTINWTYTNTRSAGVPVFTAINVHAGVAAFSTESISTGVEEVEAAGEGEAVWFNLQGVRVANPTQGLYIRVRGGKAEKVVL